MWLLKQCTCVTTSVNSGPLGALKDVGNFLRHNEHCSHIASRNGKFQKMIAIWLFLFQTYSYKSYRPNGFRKEGLMLFILLLNLSVIFDIIGCEQYCKLGGLRGACALSTKKRGTCWGWAEALSPHPQTFGFIRKPTIALVGLLWVQWCIPTPLRAAQPLPSNETLSQELP